MFMVNLYHYLGITCRFFYQLAEENAKKKAAKNAKKTKWVHF